jgi:twitching motility two-component system response regulator PilG
MAILNTESLIEATVASAKSGNRLLAEFNFRKVMQECNAEIEDPAVWLMMAWLAPSPQAMSQALERLLTVDPHNELALQGLRWAQGIANLIVQPAETDVFASTGLTFGHKYESVDFGVSCDDTRLNEVRSTAMADTQVSTDLNASTTRDSVASVIESVQETFGSLTSDWDASVAEFGYVPLEDPTSDEEYERLFAEQEANGTLDSVAITGNLGIASDNLTEEPAAFTHIDELTSSVDTDTTIEDSAPVGQTAAELVSIEESLSSTPVSESELEQANAVIVTDAVSGTTATSAAELADQQSSDNQSFASDSTASIQSNGAVAGVESDSASDTSNQSSTEELDAADLDSSETISSGAETSLDTTVLPEADVLASASESDHLADEELEYASVKAISEPVSESSELHSAAIQEVTSQAADLGEISSDLIESESLTSLQIVGLDGSAVNSNSLKDGKPRDANGHKKPTGPSILVVDDSPTVRKLLTMMLSQGGYEVSSAVDGLDAVQSIAAHVPQLIITDINMPRLDGYKLCKLVTRNARTKHIPVVMISAGIIDRLRGKLAGCSGYLAKPITPGSLTAVVEFALQESSVR